MAGHICSGIGGICSGIGNFLCPEDAPSPIFTTFAVVINGVAGVWSIVVIASESCESRPTTWLGLGIMNFFVNVFMAFYIYFRFAHKIRGSYDQPGLGPGDAACKLFLYDWGVCLYMAMLVWELVWFIIAIGVSNDYDDKCGDQLMNDVILLAVFVGVGGFLIICSLFTECCRRPRWKREQHAQTQGGAMHNVRTRIAGMLPGHHAAVHHDSPRSQRHLNDPGYRNDQRPENRGVVSRITRAIFGGGSRNDPHGQQPQQSSYHPQPYGTGNNQYPQRSEPAYPQPAGTATTAGGPPPSNPYYNA